MNKMEALNNFFYGGSGEVERRIRSQVFIMPPNAETLLKDFNLKFRIITAPKGVGKTYLLEEIHDRVIDKNKIALLIRPRDIKCESIHKTETKGGKQKKAYNELVIAIGVAIGSKIENKAIFNTAEANLYNLPAEFQYERPDLIKRFTNFLAILTKSHDAVESIRKFQYSTANRVIKSDITKFLSNERNEFWLLIDDLDDAAISKEGIDDYSNCWAIIAAAFELTNDIQSIKCLISVRDDIWHSMIHRKRLGIELDKMPRPFSLHFDENTIRNVFNKRIYEAAQLLHCTLRNRTECFFTGDVELPGIAEKHRAWGTWLTKISRNRPRDLINAVEQLISDNGQSNNAPISSGNARNIMLKFAESRLENIAREFSEICLQLRYVIEDICTQTFFEFPEIISTLEKSISARSIMLDGKILQNNTEALKKESAILLLHILHMANVVNPRVEDAEQPEGFNHVLYYQDSNLVNINNWKRLQTYQWELHPVFHPLINVYGRQKAKQTRWKKRKGS